MNNDQNDALRAYIADNDNNGNDLFNNTAQEENNSILSKETPTAKNEGTTNTPIGKTRPRMSGLPLEQLGGSSDLKYSDNLGYMKIDVKSLPTGGLFYPDDTKIMIRAARGAEIKHWSTMNDQDLKQLSQVDDILNYIIERCVNVQMPSMPLGGSWKDLKDVDKFYLLFAIREFTFIEGDNELMVPITEGKSIPVTKEMINFITIPDEVMKFYSPEDKCFKFHIGNRDLYMYIPSLGANQWLKNYAQAKVDAREGFDMDFLIFAPMLIKDFRMLSQRAYEEMVAESSMWSNKEWSVISYVRDLLSAATEPKITYTDDNGAEVSIPLTFRGGLKALFTISNPLSGLD